MTILLDSSVVIALLRVEHQHHEQVGRWFSAGTDVVATCPITQGALIRMALARDESAADALAALASLTDQPRHEFWPDDLGFGAVQMRGVFGHRQVTDAYLAQLARHRDGKLATLDRGLAALHADVAELVPTA